MTRIAPVAVDGNGVYRMPMFGDPVIIQLMCNLLRPNFSGSFDEWPKFVVHWNKYLAELSHENQYETN